MARVTTRRTMSAGRLMSSVVEAVLDVDRVVDVVIVAVDLSIISLAPSLTSAPTAVRKSMRVVVFNARNGDACRVSMTGFVVVGTKRMAGWKSLSAFPWALSQVLAVICTELRDAVQALSHVVGP